ncbi:FtsX-like permease family protein [Pseudomonas sp. HR96]|uniref:ABC transporter permease n=1 Tax=Pseudomonas sp. HR96 TaxID=1027966 RepID=UPI002A7557B2|nr:FtsX-like permease family protein [Pseudomonas sp. HR96]WPP01235.1 FtsX-like permease family protein [Pseudomonas sp. HR96]
MSVLYWSLRALLSHWRKHPVQFISVFTGLWLATALFIGVLALNGQARQSYAQASQLIGGQPLPTLVARVGGRLSQDTFVQLRRLGWPVSPALQGRMQLAGADPQRSLDVLGIEPLTLPANASLAGSVPDLDELTAFIGTPGRTWIAAQTLREWGWHPGEQPLSRDGQPLPPLQPRDGMAPGLLLMDIGAAQRLLQAPQLISRLTLPAGYHAELPAALASQLQWQAQGENADMARLTESFHLNLAALGMLAFVVGLFIVHAAIGLALEQRRPLLRTLRACGVSARGLVGVLTFELLALALLGGVAGVASGYLLASWLLPDVAASLRGLYGAQVAGALTLSRGWWLSGLGLSLLGALLAGASSLWRAARLPVLALADNEAWHGAHRAFLRRQAMVALLALFTAAGAGLCGDSLASGFVLLGSLLLAAAAGLPVLLGLLLQALGKLRLGPLAQWFIADSRQQLPGISLALMALLLALATNIGAGSMIEGFRQTFGHWLEQRLTAELYLRPVDSAQSAALQSWLQQQPGVQRVLPALERDSRVQGWPADIAGVLDDPTYREHWPLLQALDSQPWDRLFDGDSLMLSEQLARHLHLKLGDRLSLPSERGPWQPQVIAIYADYGNPRGHVLVAAAAMQRHWPTLAVSRLAVRMAATDVPGLRQRLLGQFSLDEGRIVDQSQLKQWAGQVFERTFAATGALDSLTLGVAGVALFISLLTQSQGRLGQLAPLWAMGVRRRHLLWINLGQTWLLALLTLALSVPLGILLAWCLVAVINVQAFGWRLPLQVFPAQLLQLLGLAALATALASAWPLWRLLRSRPADLLRVLIDEK